MTKLQGAVLASAVAQLFATGCTKSKPPAHEAAAATIPCAGINACKGQTACSTAHNTCAGLNACKGQGWLAVASEADCKAKGGKVTTVP